MNRLRIWPLAILCGAALLVAPMFAQTSKVSGTIRGVITDPSGALVGGATVTATNTGTGLSRTVTATGQGEYVVPDLPMGTYSVTVKATGFKELVIKNVDLHSSSIAEANAQMRLGSASEEVTVSESAVQVQTDSASVGETVTGEQVRQLPIEDDNFVELTQLQPGVSAAAGANATLSLNNKGVAGGVDFSVNGNPVTNNLFLLDGANDNDKGSNRTILIYPTIDSIAEFKMLRNSYGAEYGQASGAVISIVTRSGENKFHGTLNYSGRNDALDSFDYFAAQAANPKKDEVRHNDFDYNIGGPIIKDKLFFFWSQSWNKNIDGLTRAECAPTLAEIGGDFTGSSTVTGIAADGCGPTPTIPAADQAPGNPLKFANTDAAGQLLAQFAVVANAPPPGILGANNYFQSVPSKVNWREESLKVDFNLSKNNLITGRFTQDNWDNPAPNDTGWGSDQASLVEGNWNQPSRSALGKLTSNFGTSMVNTVQFSYSHNAVVTSAGGTPAPVPGGATSAQGLLSSINAEIPSIYPKTLKTGGIPIFWSGFAPYMQNPGGAQSLWLIAPYGNSMDTYTVNDDLSRIVGTHTLKAGVLWSFNKKQEDQNGGWDTPLGGGNGASMANWAVFTPTGNELANILTPDQVFAGVTESSTNPVDQGRWHDVEFYVADTWKARPNLTLEYGFRWSFLREPYAANNGMSAFEPYAYNPNGPATDACNGIVIVPGTNPCGAANALNASLGFPTDYSSGTPGPDRALRNNYNHAIAPRLGISWDPWNDHKTAIRAGVGQFFQRERVSSQVLLSANSPLVITTAPINRALDPQNYGQTLPNPGAAGATPGFGVDPRAVLPNSWQWNLMVERELTKGTTLEVGYVGNRGVDLTDRYDVNQVLPANRAAAAFQTGAGVNALRPYSNDGAITYYSRGAESNYNALQVLLRSRWRDTVTFSAAYTWSHTLANTELDDSGNGAGTAEFTDITNHRFDYGNATINRPQIFTANAVFYLPRLQGSNTYLKQTLGGWQYSVIGQAESGPSLTVFDTGIGPDFAAPPPPATSLQTLSGTGDTNMQRPDVVAGTSCTSGSSGSQILNANAFTLNGFTIGTIGNEARGFCQGPRAVNFDMGIYKNWSLGERFKLQFRLDAFNAFNHPTFSPGSIAATWLPGSANCGGVPCSPTNTLITGSTLDPSLVQSFGKASATLFGGREMQYGLKLTF
jgi:hypothetical protein